LFIARHRSRPDGDLVGVLAMLNALLAAADEGGRGASVIEILVLQAAAHDSSGEHLAALQALHRAVTMARPEGYVRLFLDEGPPMTAMLKALRKTRDAPAYVNHLIAATTTTATPAPDAHPLIEPLSERELSVLRLLGGDLGGPEIARQLFISLNTLRTHTKSIYAKLGVTSRQAAVNRAREVDLIPGGARRS
jgi:LuxR family maltose regulon positive regulatory protein